MWCFCIKLSIGYCFWQDVVLNVLTSAGIIKSHWLNVDRIEITLKNTLVLLEMIVFSVIQQYAFHVAPYSGEEKRKRALERKTDWLCWILDEPLWIYLIIHQNLCLFDYVNRVNGLFQFYREMVFKLIRHKIENRGDP